MKKLKKQVSYSFFSKKNNIFLGNWKLAKKKTDMSGIKGVDKKNAMLKMIKKKKFFLRKMFVWINENRDSVTRPKSENVEKNWKKWKIDLG